MDNNEFLSALNQIAQEKNISPEVILETVEAALAAAYRKDFGQKEQIIEAKIDPETMKTRLFAVRKIVEEVEEPAREITLANAKKIDKKAEGGGEIREEVFPPAEYGRVAAQTAKQVVLQRLREAERDMVFQEYKDKEGNLLNGTVQRIEGDVVMVDIGKTSGILFPSEQSKGDRYYVGQRFKVYILRVEETGREPRVLVSRAHSEMIRRLFEMEVPEITAGTVEIKVIAREAGVRSKVAVVSHQEAVDPVGSLVGKKGVRVQAVMSEIGEEKIDIILWDENPVQFIKNALAPAQVKEVILNERDKVALIKADDDQLSLAIGKGGQNVRLASKLAGWQIEIEKKAGEKPKERKLAPPVLPAPSPSTTLSSSLSDLGVEDRTGKTEGPSGKPADKSSEAQQAKEEAQRAKGGVPAPQQEPKESKGSKKKTSTKRETNKGKTHLRPPRADYGGSAEAPRTRSIGGEGK